MSRRRRAQREMPRCFCRRPAVARLLCKAHYEQWRRAQHGAALPVPMLLEGRFGVWLPAPPADLISARLTADWWVWHQQVAP